MNDLTGQTLGKYQVISRLDAGAMGEVYKGFHTSLNRHVAIKVLHPHLATAADFVERFEREASIVARLRHTNIMQVYDFDNQDDFYYMVMEFIDGPTLKKEIATRRQSKQYFTPYEIIQLANALAAALDYAHVRGVIHRDIKPANIMFDAEGQIILTDFGIVYMLGETYTGDEGRSLGTPAYAPPEQFGPEPVGIPSDIYSFGVVLYELLTGRPPFIANTMVDLILQHRQAPVPSPRQFRQDLPVAVEGILFKALHKEPEERYQRAGHLASDLRLAWGLSGETAQPSFTLITPQPAVTAELSSSLIEPGTEVTQIMSSTGLAHLTSNYGPYRGLFAFREEDAPFFFGREEFTGQLFELVREQPLLAVVGPSGSGKSSVVYAGLLPALRKEGIWIIENFRPGADPFQALAGALLPLLPNRAAPQDRPAAVDQLAQAWKRGDRRLYEVIDEVVAAQPAGKRLLLVADQFEEMFTLVEDVALRDHFLNELAETIDIQKFHDEQTFSLVLTLRADFLGQALTHRPFAAALQNADVKLGPMSRQDLVHAIAKPARRLGVAFESGLVMRIVTDVGDEPGNLPLLEFALAALWSQRQGNVMTHHAYEQIGGVAGALARHANEVYNQFAPPERRLVRRALVQMVQPGDGTEDTRRVATRDELSSDEWALVQKLADERLVVTGINEAGKETAEVVHEALIRNWERLREWMSADREYRAWQERLRATMNQWQASGQDEGALLRGAPLQQALEWAAGDTVILSTMERSFINLSQEVATRAEQEREAQRQRELEQAKALSESRRRQAWISRMAAIGLSVLLLATLCGAVFAFYQRSVAQDNALEAAVQATAAFHAQSTAVANEHIAATRAVEADNARATAEAERQEADTQRGLAEAARGEAEAERAEAVRQGRIALAQSLVSLSLARTEQTNDRELATLLAIEAARLNEASGGRVSWYLDSALRPLVSQPYFNTTLTGHTNGVRAVAFSPDGRWLASGAADNTIRLWPLADPAGETLVLSGHETPLLTVAFSADSRFLAAGDEGGTIHLWDATAPDQPPLPLLEGEVAVLALAINQAGQLAAATQEGAVRLWSLADPAAPPITLVQGDRPVLGLAFSPDGQTLALAGDDRSVRLYDLGGGTTTTLGQHDSSAIAVAFSPDQSQVASVGADNAVRVWNTAAPGSAPLVLQGHTSRVRGVVFLPDGQRLVTAGDDATLRVWNLEEPAAEAVVLPGHESRVRFLALAPDGLYVASASDDQTIRLWRTDAPAGADRILTGHEANVLAVAFSPDGATMFSSGADNNIRLWDTTTFAQREVLSGHSGRVRALALTPDLLASGSDDGTIRLWNLANLAAEPAVLADHDGSVRAVLFADGAETLYSAGDDGIIRIWTVGDPGAAPAVFATLDEAIFSLALSPDGRYLLAGSNSGTLFIWERDDPTQEPRTLNAHEARVNRLVFSPDGALLASASEDWTIRLWQWDDLDAEAALLSRHKAGVRGLAFSPDGTQLVSTGVDQIVLIWNPADPTEPPAELNGHTAAVLSVAFAPDQSLFASVSDDGTVRLWRPLETLLGMACQLVRRNLTPAEWSAFLSGEAFHATCPGLPVVEQ